MKYNALCLANPEAALVYCDKLDHCADKPFDDTRAAFFRIGGTPAETENIYLPDMSDEAALDAACDHIYSSGCRAIVHACDDMTEAGIIEAKYKLSPVMLLHKLGIIDRCAIAGGVCLDNDDLDLMAQEGTPLILLPIASAGYGYGFAPVCAALRRGIRVGIGTFDGKYNPAHDIMREAEFLRLTANAEMKKENALSEKDLSNILGFCVHA